MQDAFITKIHIDKVRHLTDMDIDLSATDRKHLILTGKNGSGKTSLLEAIHDFVLKHQRESIPSQIDGNSAALLFKKLINGTPAITVNFCGDAKKLFDVTFAYLSAKRSELIQPKTVEAIDIQGNTIITRNASPEFLKYILNLYVQYLSVQVSGEHSIEVEHYKAWFDRFTKALRDIYNCKKLELKPNMKTFEFSIVMPGREPFGLHQMADGYKAFLEIYMELLMRFDEGDGTVNYNHPAIVIIDEIEAHLHVELQKRALPFLTRMFPSVQFIVSTHSPFVITSLPDAVVYDLEKRERLENPSYYSYETVVESFLDADMYSEAIKRRFERYKELCFKERTAKENEEFLRAKTELELMAPASKELFIAFRELEQKRKAAGNDQNHQAS